MSVRSTVAASYAAARSDAALLQAALRVEEIGVLAYAAAAQALQDEARAMAQRFADHEHQHAAALETPAKMPSSSSSRRVQTIAS